MYVRHAGHCGSAHSTRVTLGIRRAEHPAVLRDAGQVDDGRRGRRGALESLRPIERDGDESDRGGNRNAECEDDRSSRRAVARARIHRGQRRRSVPVAASRSPQNRAVCRVTPRLTPPSQWPSLERGSSFVAMIELATERKTTPITPRQREVVALIAAGCSNDEVGTRLGISPRTAKAHCDVLRQKLGVRVAGRFRSPSGYSRERIRCLRGAATWLRPGYPADRTPRASTRASGGGDEDRAWNEFRRARGRPCARVLRNGLAEVPCFTGRKRRLHNHVA